jgi:hypothetical protein
MEIPPKFEIKFNRRERGARRDNQDKIQIKKPQAKLLATEGTEITESQPESVKKKIFNLTYSQSLFRTGERFLGWTHADYRKKRRLSNSRIFF